MSKLIDFESVCKDMTELYKKKNADYGDSFGKSYEEFGLTAPIIRLSDKLSRLKQLNSSGQHQVKDESIQDTLTDLAAYAIMTIVELKK